MKNKYFYAFPIALIMILGALIASYLFLSCEAQTIVYRAIIISIATAGAVGTISAIRFCEKDDLFFGLMFLVISFIFLAIAWGASGSKEYRCKKLRYYRSL